MASWRPANEPPAGCGRARVSCCCSARSSCGSHPPRTRHSRSALRVASSPHSRRYLGELKRSCAPPHPGSCLPVDRLAVDPGAQPPGEQRQPQRPPPPPTPRPARAPAAEHAPLSPTGAAGAVAKPPTGRRDGDQVEAPAPSADPCGHLAASAPGKPAPPGRLPPASPSPPAAAAAPPGTRPLPTVFFASSLGVDTGACLACVGRGSLCRRAARPGCGRSPPASEPPY